MWFNNALIYNFELNDVVDFQQCFEEEQLKPCPPHARFIYGWSPVYDEDLIQEVAGTSLFCLGKEERILPRGVINKLLDEKISLIEAQQNRTIKRSEKAQLAEDLEFELLPKSFCVQKRLFALFDFTTKRLIINTASENQASQLASLLKKSIPGLQIDPLFCEHNLSLLFAEWITNPSSLPPNFQLASDCLLFSQQDEKKKVTCKGYEMPADEILTLLSQGLVPAELSLIWQERIQFTITHDLTIKRLKSLDYLIDEFQEASQLEEEALRRDASLTILSGELRGLINELMASLNSKAITAELVETEDQIPA